MKRPARTLPSAVLAAAVFLSALVPLSAAGGGPDKHSGGHKGGMDFCFGNLHSHTACSDGTGTPEEAFRWARDSAGFDFCAITDHAEQLTAQKCGDTRARADQFDADGRFAALAGFEWTGEPAHVCVYNTSACTCSRADPGVNQPGRTWYLAEGSTWPDSQEWVCIQNPNRASATVSVKYMFQYCVTRRQAVRLPAHSRCTIDVNSFAGPCKDVSARLDSNVPVVAGRPMYFDFRGRGGGGIREFTCVLRPASRTTITINGLMSL